MHLGDLYDIDSRYTTILDVALIMIYLSHTGPLALQKSFNRHWDSTASGNSQYVTAEWNNLAKAVDIKCGEDSPIHGAFATHGVRQPVLAETGRTPPNCASRDLVKQFSRIANTILLTYAARNSKDSGIPENELEKSPESLEILASPAFSVILMLIQANSDTVFSMESVVAKIRQLIDQLKADRPAAGLLTNTLFHDLNVVCLKQLLMSLDGIVPEANESEKNIRMSIFVKLITALTRLYMVESLRDTVIEELHGSFLAEETLEHNIYSVSELFRQTTQHLLEMSYPIKVAEPTVDIEALRQGEILLIAKLQLEDNLGLVTTVILVHLQYIESVDKNPLRCYNARTEALLYLEGKQYGIRCHLLALSHKFECALGLVDKVISILNSSKGVQSREVLMNCVKLLEQASIQLAIVEKHLLSVDIEEKTAYFKNLHEVLCTIVECRCAIKKAGQVDCFRNMLSMEVISARTLQYIAANIRNTISLVAFFNKRIQDIIINVAKDAERELRSFMDSDEAKQDYFPVDVLMSRSEYPRYVCVLRGDCKECGKMSPYCAYPRRDVTSLGISGLSKLSSTIKSTLKDFARRALRMCRYFNSELDMFETSFYLNPQGVLVEDQDLEEVEFTLEEFIAYVFHGVNSDASPDN